MATKKEQVWVKLQIPGELHRKIMASCVLDNVKLPDRLLEVITLGLEFKTGKIMKTQINYDKIS